MNAPMYNRRPRRRNGIRHVVPALLILNGLVFALQQLHGRFMMVNFALWPAGIEGSRFEPWQLVTYGFLHDPQFLPHILFNMFGLWMFGSVLEREMGGRRFLVYYMTCVIGAGIVQLVFAGSQDVAYPTVGASGGVFGILLAYGLLFPNRKVMLLFPPIPMKAIHAVLLFGLLELFLGFSGLAPRIAHFAHLGGMLFGFLLLIFWGRRRRR
jgi:membrane associated rhomboid family serine protease